MDGYKRIIDEKAAPRCCREWKETLEPRCGVHEVLAVTLLRETHTGQSTTNMYVLIQVKQMRVTYEGMR